MAKFAGPLGQAGVEEKSTVPTTNPYSKLYSRRNAIFGALESVTASGLYAFFRWPTSSPAKVRRSRRVRCLI